MILTIKKAGTYFIISQRQTGTNHVNTEHRMYINGVIVAKAMADTDGRKDNSTLFHICQLNVGDIVKIWQYLNTEITEYYPKLSIFNI